MVPGAGTMGNVLHVGSPLERPAMRHRQGLHAAAATAAGEGAPRLRPLHQVQLVAAVAPHTQSTMGMHLLTAHPEGGETSDEQPSTGHRRRLPARSSSSMRGVTGSMFVRGEK